MGGHVSPTITCAGAETIYVYEVFTIVAMRGRNPDNPSERGRYKQRLEPNTGGDIKHYHLSPEGQPRVGGGLFSMPRGSGLKRRNADGISMVTKGQSSPHES